MEKLIILLVLMSVIAISGCVRQTFIIGNRETTSTIECNCPENYVQQGNYCTPKCYFSTPRCLLPSILCNTGINITDKLSCHTKSDCAPSQCCHPTDCVNAAYKPDCKDTICSLVCAPGTMDCGQGNCDCVNNECKAIIKTPLSEKEQTCINSGGTVGTFLCCQSIGDFPNTCVIGACGCSPTNSHEVKVCDCPAEKCFDGNTCK